MKVPLTFNNCTFNNCNIYLTPSPDGQAAPHVEIVARDNADAPPVESRQPAENESPDCDDCGECETPCGDYEPPMEETPQECQRREWRRRKQKSRADAKARSAAGCDIYGVTCHEMSQNVTNPRDMSQNVTKSPENVTKSVTSPVTCHASRDCCNNNNNQSPLKNLKEQQSPTTVISKREKEFPSEKSKFPVTLRANKEPPALGQIMRQAGLSPEQLAAYPESPESPPVGMLEKALAAKRGPGRPRSRWQSESYDYEAIVADQLWLFLVPPLEPGGGEEPFPVEMKTPEFRAAWDDWLAVRVHHGWPKMTAKVLTNCLKVLVARFKKLGAGAPVADLRATIAKGWDSRIYVDNGYVAK